MTLTLKALYDELKQYKPELTTTDNENSVIKAVKILTEETQLFEPSILYIATVSTLLNFMPSSMCCINLLIIVDDDFDKDIFKSFNVNFVLLYKITSTAFLCNEVQDILITHYHLLKTSKTLMDTLLQGKGLQKIIELGYNFLKNPVCLCDASAKMITHTNCFMEDEPYWNERIKIGYQSNEIMETPEFKAWNEIIIKSDTPILAKSAFGLKHNSMVGKIKVDHSIVAYLTVIEYNQPFKKDDYVFVSLLCEVLSFEMKKSKLFKNANGEKHESLLKDLLDGKIQDDKIIQERLKSSDLRLQENLYILRLISIR